MARFELFDMSAGKYYSILISSTPDHTKAKSYSMSPIRTKAKITEKKIKGVLATEGVVKIFNEPGEFKTELKGVKLVLRALTATDMRLVDSTPLLVIDDQVVLATVHSNGGRVLYKQFETTLFVKGNESWVFRAVLSITPLLDALHRNKVYHRDIKPENIFIDTQTGRVVLGDFGFVGFTCDGFVRSDDKIMLGTLNYLPPHYVSKDAAGDTLNANFLRKLWTTKKRNFSRYKHNIRMFGNMTEIEMDKYTSGVTEQWDFGIAVLNREDREHARLPLWFMDCYALGFTIFECATHFYNMGSDKLVDVFIIACVLMRLPKDGEMDGAQRFDFVQKWARKCARARKWARSMGVITSSTMTTTLTTTTMYQDKEVVSRRKIGEGASATVYKIIDTFGINMLLCQSVVKLHCFRPDQGVSTVTYSRDMQGPSTGLLMAYQKNRNKAANMLRAARLLCADEVTNKLFPDIYADDKMKLLGLSATELNLPGQPTMLLYNAFDRGVPMNDETLWNLHDFLTAGHRMGVIHGDICNEVLVTLNENGDVGIAAFSGRTFYDDITFARAAHEDVRKLYNLFGKEPPTVSTTSMKSATAYTSAYKKSTNKQMTNTTLLTASPDSNLTLRSSTRATLRKPWR
jgi:hypothetical protein